MLSKLQPFNNRNDRRTFEEFVKEFLDGASCENLSPDDAIIVFAVHLNGESLTYYEEARKKADGKLEDLIMFLSEELTSMPDLITALGLEDPAHTSPSQKLAEAKRRNNACLEIYVQSFVKNFKADGIEGSAKSSSYSLKTLMKKHMKSRKVELIQYDDHNDINDSDKELSSLSEAVQRELNLIYSPQYDQKGQPPSAPLNDDYSILNAALQELSIASQESVKQEKIQCFMMDGNNDANDTRIRRPRDTYSPPLPTPSRRANSRSRSPRRSQGQGQRQAVAANDQQNAHQQQNAEHNAGQQQQHQILGPNADELAQRVMVRENLEPRGRQDIPEETDAEREARMHPDLFLIIRSTNDIVTVRATIVPWPHDMEGMIAIPGLRGTIIGRVDGERNAELIAREDAIRYDKRLGVYIQNNNNNGYVANVLIADRPAGVNAIVANVNDAIHGGIAGMRNDMDTQINNFTTNVLRQMRTQMDNLQTATTEHLNVLNARNGQLQQQQQQFGNNLLQSFAQMLRQAFPHQNFEVPPLNHINNVQIPVNNGLVNNAQNGGNGPNGPLDNLFDDVINGANDALNNGLLPANNPQNNAAIINPPNNQAQQIPQNLPPLNNAYNGGFNLQNMVPQQNPQHPLLPANNVAHQNIPHINNAAAYGFIPPNNGIQQIPQPQLGAQQLGHNNPQYNNAAAQNPQNLVPIDNVGHLGMFPPNNNANNLLMHQLIGEPAFNILSINQIHNLSAAARDDATLALNIVTQAVTKKDSLAGINDAVKSELIRLMVFATNSAHNAEQRRIATNNMIQAIRSRKAHIQRTMRTKTNNYDGHMCMTESDLYGLRRVVNPNGSFWYEPSFTRTQQPRPYGRTTNNPLLQKWPLLCDFNRHFLPYTLYCHSNPNGRYTYFMISSDTQQRTDFTVEAD